MINFNIGPVQTFFVAISFLAFLSIIKRIGSFFIIVDQGYSVVVLKRGQYSRTLTPGWYLLSIWEKPKRVSWSAPKESHDGKIVFSRFNDHHIPTIEQPYDCVPFTLQTKDQISISVNVVMFYRINDVKKAVFDVTDLYDALRLQVHAITRSEIIKLHSAEIFNNQVNLINAMMEGLTRDVASWGVVPTRIEFQSFELPKEILKTNAKKAAEQNEHSRRIAAEKSAQILEALRDETTQKRLEREAIRKRASQTAELERATNAIKSKREQALITAQMIKDEADANAYAVVKQAEAEEKRFKLLSQFGLNQTSLIQLKAVEALKTAASNPTLSVSITPANLSSLASLFGLKPSPSTLAE